MSNRKKRDLLDSRIFHAVVQERYFSKEQLPFQRGYGGVTDADAQWCSREAKRWPWDEDEAFKVHSAKMYLRALRWGRYIEQSNNNEPRYGEVPEFSVGERVRFRIPLGREHPTATVVDVCRGGDPHQLTVELSNPSGKRSRCYCHVADIERVDENDKK